MVILTSFAPPTEGVQHEEKNTGAFIGQKAHGTGTLYIAESRVSWRSDAGEGFSLEYPAISLHAVSKDTSTFPHPCLYLMIDAKLDDEEEGSDNSSEGGDDSGAMTEIRFTPQNTESLDAMFHAMSDCQALHPDQEADSSEEDDDQFFYGGEGEEHLTEEGQNRLREMEGMFDTGLIQVEPPIPAIGQIGALSVRAVNGAAVGAGDATTSDEPMEMGQFEDADNENH